MNMDIYAQIREDLEKNRDEMGRSLVKSLETVGSLGMADIISATVIRTEFNRVLSNCFEQFDLLLTPATATDAFMAGGPPPAEINGESIPLLGAIAFTYPFNLSGHPAASVPVELSDSDLPVGLQIVGPRHRDDLVLQAAYAYEQAKPWNDKWPEIG